MKINEQNQKVFAFIQANPKTAVEPISEKTGIFKLQVFKILKLLQTEGRIQTEKIENEIVYSVIKGITVTEEEPKNSKATKPAKESDEVKLNTGRDTTKFMFPGDEKKYGKGPFVLALIKKYCEKNKKATLTKLREVFPDELTKPYGTVQEIKKAKKLSAGRDRFFMKQDQVIRTADKKVAVVSNQIGAKNIKAFLAIAKELGFTVRSVG